MKMLNITNVAVCMLLCASLAAALTGCTSASIDTNTTSATEGASSSARPKEDAPSVAPAKLTQDPPMLLPLENTDYKSAEIENFQTIGAQFLCDDPLAYKVAAAIYRYRDYNNSFIFEQSFASIAELPPEVLVEIAASQTAHIDLYSKAFQNAPSNHPIKQFCKEQSATGKSISFISYGEDVRAAAKNLFHGAYELPQQEGVTVKYHETLDLYYLDSQSTSMVTDYPIVVSIEENEAGSIMARVVNLCYWDSYDAWALPNGAWETDHKADIASIKAYVTAHLDDLPQSVYTLHTDDMLISGFTDVEEA